MTWPHTERKGMSINIHEPRVKRLARLATMAGQLYMRDLQIISTTSDIHKVRYQQIARAMQKEIHQKKG